MRNPILRVLSTLTSHRVRHLLMGGQACVLYGAAEFSRDTDIVLLANPENLKRLSTALEELQAARIAVPPFEPEYLERGHAIHFRCRHPEARGTRLDVMSVLRSLGPFDELWRRRTTLDLPGGLRIELLALPDLIQAKKTQRDKDWPMIRRLVEAHYATHRDHPTEPQIRLWLTESRTPSMLLALARRHCDLAAELAGDRPLLNLAAAGDEEKLAAALQAEEMREREADRRYWEPLKSELEQLRRSSRDR